jgi:hypothetical protein
MLLVASGQMGEIRGGGVPMRSEATHVSVRS